MPVIMEMDKPDADQAALSAKLTPKCLQCMMASTGDEAKIKACMVIKAFIKDTACSMHDAMVLSSMEGGDKDEGNRRRAAHGALNKAGVSQACQNCALHASMGCRRRAAHEDPHCAEKAMLKCLKVGKEYIQAGKCKYKDMKGMMAMGGRRRGAHEKQGKPMPSEPCFQCLMSARAACDAGRRRGAHGSCMDVSHEQCLDISNPDVKNCSTCLTACDNDQNRRRAAHGADCEKKCHEGACAKLEAEAAAAKPEAEAAATTKGDAAAAANPANPANPASTESAPADLSGASMLSAGLLGVLSIAVAQLI
jgi:hypothetical protein